MDPVEVLLKTLKSYLSRRGALVASSLRAAGQDRVKIAFYGLYKSFEPTGSYSRFMDVVRAILRDESARRRLEDLGVKFVYLGGEHYLEVPLSLILALMEGEDPR